MAMTNAEKQAAWRRRRDAHTAQLQAELEQLRNQSKPADREQQLHAERTEPNARQGDELSTARKLIEETSGTTSASSAIFESMRRSPVT